MVPKTSVISVCFIAPKAYPLFNPATDGVFGGAEVDFYLLANELAKDKNFAVSFITADYGQSQTEMFGQVRVIRSLDFKKNPINGAIKVWRAMKQADADIYALKTASPGTPLVALFCMIGRKVFVYRTASAKECDGTYLKEHYFLGRAFVWSLRRAKIILAQNSNDKKNLARTTGLSAEIIPNAHPLTELTENQRDTILWVGRSAQVKRPELFIRLAEKMPHERFTMICQKATGDRNYGELAALAKQVENLTFIEGVAFKEVDAYFQRARVFVNTSDIEGFPNTFIQACNCAAPIVSLNVNPDGFLDEYNCGTSCDGNWDKFTDSLRFMLAENRFIEFGKNARTYAEDRHDITRIVGRYKELFGELARRSFTAVE